MIALEYFCFALPVIIPVSEELSVTIGVMCWGWENYSKLVPINSPFRKLTKRPPSSDSIKEEIVLHMTPYSIWMG